jgi:hypothetical protein
MDYRRLDLNLLVVLDALLEERGVHATARRLHMSQPNVSFSLGKLRQFFKDDLLVRMGNGMPPHGRPAAESSPANLGDGRLGPAGFRTLVANLFLGRDPSMPAGQAIE